MLPIHFEPLPDYILPHIKVRHLQEARLTISAGNLIQLIGARHKDRPINQFATQQPVRWFAAKLLAETLCLN